jgi:ABC-2 type transport system ATP-binding protein
MGNKGLRGAGWRKGECAQRPPGVSDEGAEGGHVPCDFGVEDVGGVGAAEAASALKSQEEGRVPQPERPQGVEEEGHLGGLLLSEEGRREVELSRAHPAGLGGGAPRRRQGQKEGGLEVLRQGTGEEEAQKECWKSSLQGPAKHHPPNGSRGGARRTAQARVPRTVLALEVSRLRKRYGPVQAVDGVSFQVHPGEVVGLLGPNGAGKSTTLRLLAGLVRPDEGTVRLAEHDVRHARTQALAAAGFLIESPALPAELTALSALAWVAHLGGRAVDAGRCREALSEVGLTEVAHRRVRALSLGMKQRLSLAAAMLERPPLLVLDEPMNGLDPPGVRDMGELLLRLARAGTALLVSSHLLDEVERTCQRVLVMAKGRLVAEQPVDAAHPGALRDLFFSVTDAGAA